MISWPSGLRRTVKAVFLVGVGSNSANVTFNLPQPILISEESLTNPLDSHVLLNINYVDIPNETICVFLPIFLPI